VRLRHQLKYKKAYTFKQMLRAHTELARSSRPAPLV
jgi:hypothetical protein